MNKVKILIIDTGMNSSIDNLKTNILLDLNNNSIFEKNIKNAVNEHGQIIAEIINSLCSDIELHSICIFDKTLSSDSRLLISALEIAVILKPDIINLSLGTFNLRYFFKLKSIINKLAKLNCILVISHSNINQKSYLPYMKNIISVKGEFFKNRYDFKFKDGVMYAPFTTKILNIKSNLEGNSIATAYASAHIANIKKKNINYSYIDIIEILKSYNERC